MGTKTKLVDVVNLKSYFGRLIFLLNDALTGIEHFLY